MRSLRPVVSTVLPLALFGCTPDRGENMEPPPPSGDGLGTGDGADDATGGDSGSGSEDGGVIDWPDIGTTGECSPLLQDCDEGQKCTAWADDGGGFWNANRCVEVTGTGVEGDPCTTEGGGVSGLDDCDKGFICLNISAEGGGACVAFCQGAERTCPSGDNCAVYNDGVLPLCLPGCDPLLQDCPAAQACINTPAGEFICFSDASGAGGAEGEPCPVSDGENSCDPGLWCGPGWAGCTDVNCCTPYCDITEANACTAPNECVSFYGEPSSAPPEYANVGVCIVPE